MSETKEYITPTPISDNIEEWKISSMITSLEAPVFVEKSSSFPGLLFVGEQRGIVYIYNEKENELRSTPFIDITEKISILNLNPRYDERGLLGFAFAPNGKKVYIFYNTVDSKTKKMLGVLAAYNVDNSDLSTSSETVKFKIVQPYNNHCGGTLAFGPDGYLYLSIGDGGGPPSMDPTISNPAQDPKSFAGKILRFSPSQLESKKGELIPEIYAMGLRNPWGFSFDNKGRLFATDPAENKGTYEEVNIITKGGNYGWRIMSGPVYLSKNRGNHDDFILPIYSYEYAGGAIVGGRWDVKTESFIFGDFNGDVFSLSETKNDKWSAKKVNIDLGGDHIRALGLDGNDNVLLLTSKHAGPQGKTGKIVKIVNVDQTMILNG